MASDENIRLKYASKQSRISNYWKYYKGQTAGLKRLNVADKKRAQEQAFAEWVNADEDRKKKYGNVLADFESSQYTS